MSTNFLMQPWLPAFQGDFTSACRGFAAATTPQGETARWLASFALDQLKLRRLSRSIAKRMEAGDDLAPLSRFRLGVLSGSTFDLIEDCLPAAAARHGVALELVTTAYGQVFQEALDPQSTINAGGLDAVLLILDHRWLDLARPALDDAAEKVSNAAGQIESIVKALRRNSPAAPILQTVPPPPLSLFGNYERRVPGSVRSMIHALNDRIVEIANENGCYLADIAALAERVGTDAWYDETQWFAYKLPFASQAAPAYADVIGRLLGSIRGKSRKCLVLDLDNTLWGGVIGDDGMEGIVIGYGSAAGEAFSAVQALAAQYRDRGIVLAVSSKNNEDAARRPFREHPDMILRETDIAVFQANWIDKASNLEAIARALNIGLDALVFLDDNPAERAHVRAALPMVATPELPGDPSLYPWYLAAAGYFEAVSFVAEDATRARSYAADAQRAEVMAKARDLEEYLAALEMSMTASSFDQQGRQRITQLINKTNQFNLTTRRYSETEVEAFENSNSAYTLQVRLSDRYGDLGMIAVVICKQEESAGGLTWDVDSWLMSCRVLGRRVEEAMLDTVASDAKARGVSKITGSYIPTAKNGMVADLLPRLGFQLLDSGADGSTRYVFDVATYERKTLPMKVLAA